MMDHCWRLCGNCCSVRLCDDEVVFDTMWHSLCSDICCDIDCRDMTFYAIVWWWPWCLLPCLTSNDDSCSLSVCTVVAKCMCWLSLTYSVCNVCDIQYSTYSDILSDAVFLWCCVHLMHSWCAFGTCIYDGDDVVTIFLYVTFILILIPLLLFVSLLHYSVDVHFWWCSCNCCSYIPDIILGVPFFVIHSVILLFYTFSCLPCYYLWW